MSLAVTQSKPPMAGDWITPEEAWRRLERHLRPLPGELETRRRSWRRVMARDLAARIDVPAQDVSAMDGYAVGESATTGALPVRGTIAAGDAPGATLEPGTALRIMTGAPFPAGADRVVPIELTDGEVERVTLHDIPAAGSHVRRRGEVVRAGEPLLPAGTICSPAVLGNLATHGITTLEVHRAPRVAVVTTGDEVVPAEVEPEAGQLRDSHTDFLVAAGRGLGLSFDSLGIAADSQDALHERISSGMGSDVLIIGGGVSKGAYDWVADTLDRCGCDLLFHGVALQPGKPMLAAIHAGGLVFGLPGNPNSVMVTFALFVRPALRRMLGYEDGFWAASRDGVLTSGLAGARDRDRFVPARVLAGDGRPRIEPISVRGSHDMQSFARAEALVRVRAGDAARAEGDPCSWQPLEP
jgi:molybdopterin molybdotransferase